MKYKFYDYESVASPKITFEQFIKLFLNYERKIISEYCPINNIILGNTDKFIKLLKSLKEKKGRIIGDYDVDGVCATVIFLKTLKHLGYNVDFQLPDRFIDGYGLNVNIVKKAIKDKVDYIITVDNGIRAFEAIKFARDNGLTVLLTDHHEPDVTLPDANVVVNSKVDKGNAVTSELCGAMTAYLVCQQIDPVKWNDLKNECVELSAVATVSDVMPLIAENRTLLKILFYKSSHNSISSVPLENLLDEMKLSKYSMNTETISFGIGPCLNASGRLANATIVVDFLMGNKTVINDLIELNNLRKELTLELKKKCFDILAKKKSTISNVVYIEGISEGIIGILAGKICEETGLPSFVFTNTKKGIIKGSGRSPKGVNLIETTTKALKLDESIVVGFGGHAGAMGISLKNKNSVEIFENNFNKIMSKIEIPEFTVNVIKFPKTLSVEEIKKVLNKFEPYGNEFEEPLFSIEGKIVNIKYLKEHTVLTVKTENEIVTLYYFFVNLDKNLSFKDAKLLFKIHSDFKNNKMSYSFYVKDILTN